MYHLLEFTNKGIYCPQADVYIDPWRRTDNAIITHAHGDHIVGGCGHYLTHKHSSSLLRMRLGEQISLRSVEYGETFSIRGVKFSLHPAGHIIGSAQIRVEYNGQVWVVSGDYKLQNDSFCAPFEPVKCNVFITESTFGLPVYQWQPQQIIMDEIAGWIAENIAAGRTSVLMGYSIGKMQRLLVNLPIDGNIVYAHSAIYNVNERLRDAGFSLPKTERVKSNISKEILKGTLVLAPPGVDYSTWLNRLPDFELGYCSGWLATHPAKTKRTLNKGFILSDHADWVELNKAVKETGAETVYVTHGFKTEFVNALIQQGLNAKEIKTMYGQKEDII